MSSRFKSILHLVIVVFAIVLIAACKKTETKYEVKFYVDNNLEETVEVSKEGTIDFPADPAKDGYVFKGWFNNVEGEGDPVKKTAKFAADTNLYAVFEKEPEPTVYTVTFKVDDDVIKEVTFTNPSDPIEEPLVPEKAGYEGVWEDYELDYEDMIVKANYSLKEFFISFLDEDDELIEKVSFTIETEEIEEPDLPNKDGYSGRWTTYLLYEPEDQTVKPQYSLNTYYVTFLAGKEYGIIVDKIAFTVEDMNVNAPSYIPRNPGHSAKWADYTLELKDMVVKAEYTALGDYIPVYPESLYFDAKDIVDQLLDKEALGLYDPATGVGNIVPSDLDEEYANAVFADGEIEFVSNSGRYLQYEGVEGSTYRSFTFEGQTFHGFIKTGGASSVLGRYIILKPKVGATFSMWVQNSSAFPEHLILLLSELKNPVGEGGVLDADIVVDQQISYGGRSEKISFDLIGGETYYIWFPQDPAGYPGHGNRFIRGFEYVLDPTDVAVESLKLDTTDVTLEFAQDAPFNHDGLKVYAVDADENEYLLDSSTYRVEASTEEPGKQTVTVKYGDTLVATYEIDILDVVKYTAKFMDGDKVVAEIKFNSDATELPEIPKVPTKDGYTSKWETYKLPATGDIEIKVVYTAIKYKADFVIDGKVVKSLTYTVESKIKDLLIPEVPFKQGFLGKWEDFELLLEDITINAVYTDNSNVYVDLSEHEDTHIGGRDIRDAAGATGTSGNISEPKPGVQINEFFFAIGRAIQFDRANTTKVYNGIEYRGRFKAGGAPSLNDRWIKVTPKDDAVLTLYGTYSAAGNMDVWLLSELFNPAGLDMSDDRVIDLQIASGTETDLSFNLEGGKEYWIWPGGNLHVNGFALVYQDVTHEVDEITVDVNDVKTEFEVNEE